MNAHNERLSSLVRRLRKASGLSIRDLEAETGIHRANISRLERGEASRPKPETLTALAAAFGVDASELLEAAGYTADRAAALPAIKPYLRAKYSHLSASARQELVEFVKRLEAEQTVAPRPARSRRKTTK